MVRSYHHNDRKDVGEKWCPGCERPYPATVDYFHRDRTRAGGLSGYCKMCKRDKLRGYPIEGEREALGLRPISENRSKKVWTDAEITWLEGTWGKKQLTEQSYFLRRTPLAIQKKAEALGLGKGLGVFMTGQVAEIMGVSRVTVYKWVENKYLPAHRYPGSLRNGAPGQRWVVLESALVAFIRKYPELLEAKRIDRIRYPEWRALVEQSQRANPARHTYRVSHRVWEPWEDAYLLNHFAKSDREIGDHLRRTKNSVRLRRRTLRENGHRAPKRKAGAVRGQHYRERRRAA